jgi:hypothetical protein
MIMILRQMKAIFHHEFEKHTPESELEHSGKLKELTLIEEDEQIDL